MKTKLITIGMLLLFCSTLFAQREQNKIGYVDMDYILENISDYKEANNQLNQKIETWKGEIETQQQKIRDLKEDLDNERPLLTQDLIDERQDEIDYYQKKMMDYQQERFGPEGDMIAQRRQIMQPIQDEVFNAVQEMGLKREYDFIFDSSADALMLFSAPRHDISDQILAGIRRHSRKLTKGDKEESESDKKDEEYKSVIQSRLDKEKDEERESLRQEKLDERQEMMDERQRKRDSVRNARQEQFQARRDSLQRARNQHSNNDKSANNNIKEDTEGNAPGQETVNEKTSSDSSPRPAETPQKETKSTNNQNEEQRESIQKQRQEQQEALKEERAAQRDSIQRARQEAVEKRKKERDSIIEARKLDRNNRNK